MGDTTSYLAREPPQLQLRPRPAPNLKVHGECVESEVESFVSRLRNIAQRVEEEWKQFREYNHQHATQKIDQLQKAKQSKGSIVRLNVGGQKFETTKDTLLSEEDSFFSTMLGSGRWSPDFQDDDGNEEWFIDRDPCAFSVILEYLRQKREGANQAAADPPTTEMMLQTDHLSSNDLCTLKRDIDFYQLHSLIPRGTGVVGIPCHIDDPTHQKFYAGYLQHTPTGSTGKPCDDSLHLLVNHGNPVRHQGGFYVKLKTLTKEWLYAEVIVKDGNWLPFHTHPVVDGLRWPLDFQPERCFEFEFDPQNGKLRVTAANKTSAWFDHPHNPPQLSISLSSSDHWSLGTGALE